MKKFNILIAIILFIQLAYVFFLLGRLWELNHADFTMAVRHFDTGFYVNHRPLILEN